VKRARLKGALHVHTTCSDGTMTPEEALRIYRDLDFDFIALTDHDYLMKPDAYAEVPDVFEGMLVFKGIERTVFANGYVHINEIPGVNVTVRIFNHPAEYPLTVKEVIARLDEIGPTFPIDAVEVSLYGFYTPEYDTEAIPYPNVVSDDAHDRAGCGRAWIEVDCPKDRDAILRAIRGGRVCIRYNSTAHQSESPNRGGVGSG
jgi:hypothetical protein